MSGPMWFIGAGASAPFGIPTMQQMVNDFKEELNQKGSNSENELFDDIWKFLDANLGRKVDLEAVFTIVDSIIHWSPERFGIAALYHVLLTIDEEMGSQTTSRRVDMIKRPKSDSLSTANDLRIKFENFIKDKCKTPDESVAKIEESYGKLFDTIIPKIGPIEQSKGHYHGNMPIFTTNYDAILEHYWIDCVKIALNTGFRWDPIAQSKLWHPQTLINASGTRLFKLHGSITWFDDPEYGLTEQTVIPKGMQKWTGKKFSGQVLLYPIEEKQLYVNPYMPMFYELSNQLANNPHWIVIGYSFGDRIIRDIFIGNSNREKNMVLLHPEATEIAKRLSGFKGNLFPINGRFADTNEDVIYSKMIYGLTKNE